MKKYPTPLKEQAQRDLNNQDDISKDGIWVHIGYDGPEEVTESCIVALPCRNFLFSWKNMA